MNVTEGAPSPTVAGRLCLAMIRGYRLVISPLLPPSCRFAPSCSEYALIAVERFGAVRGSWLAVRRLARCHPFHRGGWDPVPEKSAGIHPSCAHTSADDGGPDSRGRTAADPSVGITDESTTQLASAGR
jgi:putative membrane protein insertion efficiency factor